ncbi:hypothetical protein PPL_01385 [Heterostelium album PN500]|uniref:RNA-directed DNA polymerase n=1 Tax=Heterostelium pallidum (strain ATCC 26659 / Pp 5 / PN500) TaxID=670386 RepID=D3AZ45_HETP5|nr:hypothetical protein PPL_01385 [Heterostelium album PN500]EFA85602.1 hypothetical protein PPL_01385 [Heterostelium album PN500]|eukprot:XP_020437709.1 hypothetical protein PPL_01385 [Heterostelium album PN500]
MSQLNTSIPTTNDETNSGQMADISPTENQAETNVSDNTMSITNPLNATSMTNTNAIEQTPLSASSAGDIQSATSTNVTNSGSPRDTQSATSTNTTNNGSPSLNQSATSTNATNGGSPRTTVTNGNLSTTSTINNVPNLPSISSTNKNATSISNHGTSPNRNVSTNSHDKGHQYHRSESEDSNSESEDDYDDDNNHRRKRSKKEIGRIAFQDPSDPESSDSDTSDQSDDETVKMPIDKIKYTRNTTPKSARSNRHRTVVEFSSQALRDARARIRAVSFNDMLLASNKDLIERAAQFLVSNPLLGDEGAFEAAVTERVDLLGIQSLVSSHLRDQVKNYTAKIPLFVPDMSDTQTFISQVENVVPEDRLRCVIALSKLSEEAITSVSSAEDAEILKRTMKWKEFASILTNTFGIKRESDEYVTDLKNLRLEQFETTHKFIVKFREIYSKSRLSQTDIATQLYSLLPSNIKADPELTKAHHKKSINALTKRLNDLGRKQLDDKLRLKREEKVMHFTTRNHQPVEYHTSNVQPNLLQKWSPNNTNKRSAPPSVGQNKTKFTEKKSKIGTCSICKKGNHLPNNCFYGKFGKFRDIDPATGQRKQANAFLCSMPGTINNICSNINLLSFDLLQESDIKNLTDVNITLNGINKDSSTLSKQINKNITINNKVFKIPFFIINSKTNFILLGTETLQNLNLKIDFKNKIISLPNVDKENNIKELAIKFNTLNDSIQTNLIETRNCLISQSESDNDECCALVYLNDISVDENTNKSNTHEKLDESKNSNHTFESNLSKKIKNLILNKYPDVVKPFDKELPPSRGDFDFKINLTVDQPPKPKNYPIPHSFLDELEKQINTYLENGQITPSQSAFAAPLLFIKKKDGGWRLCVDYRSLNGITIKDTYPLPNITEVLNNTRDGVLFSKIDLLQGYHQIRVHENDQSKTAFRTSFGVFQYTVLPFGLTNAPACFQRLMDSIFQRHVIAKKLLVYLDDLLIKTNIDDEDKHIQDVLEIVDLLNQNKLKIKLTKCIFGQYSLEYLGHIIGHNKLIPINDKILAIKNWKQPITKRELRGFLGLTNYYRKFIPKLSEIEAPLIDITRKNKLFKWEDIHTETFNLIKNQISDSSFLFIPDYKLTFHIDCDASNDGIGHVIYQYKDNIEQEDNKQIVLYGSKKFNTTERDYHVFEQEVMAIKHALESNYHMLLGYKIVIHTDHQNILFINNKLNDNTKPKLIRWLQYIFSFNPTLIYKKGSDNVIADGLSRYTYSTTISIDDNDLIAMIENGYIEEETQIKNKTIHPSKYYKSKSVKTEGKLKYFEDKIVIPQVRSIIKRILFIYHDSLLAGHHGIEQTLELISRHFIWEGIAKDVTNYVKACHTCNKATDARGQSIGKLQPLIVPTKCFESISMDFIPLIDTEYKGIKYNKVWVIVDRLSKMVRLIPVHSTYTSKDLAEIFMKEIFKHHGMPVEIVSDRDSKFTSKFWKDLMDILNCEIRTTTTENQQANGQVESIIRYLGNLFRKAIIATYNEENHDEWITLVDTIEFCVNNSIHHGCEYSPFKIYTGENPITPLSLIQYKLKMNSSNVDIENMINSKRNQLKIVRNWLFDNQYNMRIQYNKNKKEMDIKVGDSVYLRKFRSNPKNKIKLETRFDGPYEVTNVNGLNVTVANVESGTKRKRINPSFTRHAKYFKKHNSLDDEDDDDIEFGEVEEEDEIEIDSITQNEQNNQNNNNDDTDDTEAMDIDSELDLVTNNNSTTNNNPPINTPDSNTLILDNIPNSTTTHPIIHNTLTFHNERGFSESSEITNFQRISAKEIKEAFEKKNKLTVLEEYIQYHNSHPNHPPTKQSAKILIALINANIIRKDTMFVTRKRTFNLTNKRDAKTEYLFNIGGVQGWILDNDVHQSYKSLTGDYRNWLKTNSN